MSSPKTAAELLDMFYLDMRSALVETAATFDRIQRAEGGAEVMKDPRMEALRSMGALLQSDDPGRARRFLESLSVGDDA